MNSSYILERNLGMGLFVEATVTSKWPLAP